MIGSRLAHFDVTAYLGSGGFGDVYEATDTKLGRSVAIKLLPEAFSHDPERVARFRREARVLASLNHHNIATIHGLEESDGRKFLVMELVPGDTLAVRIKRGPVAVDESLQIAKQILDALEYAHEKGVMHRDLKFANIKVTPEGNVKVLDFGLAKAFEGDSADADLSNSPTLSAMATEKGVILGTAAYMSPEQAKGARVDRRTDIFAFGSVLYEMLTGRQAFTGETVGDILAAVIRAEPDWNRLPADTPAAVRRLLRRCMQKDRNRRFKEAGDVRIEIEEAREAGTETEAAGAPAAGKPGKSWMVVAAAAVLAAAVLTIPAVLHLRETPPPSPPSPPETRTEILTPATTDPVSFALSPDGRQLVFVASGPSGDGASRLWLRPLAATSPQSLAGTERALYPFWSPDSRSVAFFADGKLKRLDIGGGQPQALTNAVPRGGTWNSDGVILFARNTTGTLFRVSASGSEAAAVTKLERQASHRFPYFLPDGRQFLFYALGTPETRGIYLGSLDSGETKRLTAAEGAGVYMPSGWLLWLRGGTLVAQRLDLGRRELAGDPVTLADPVAVDTNLGVGAVSVSATGLVAYRPGGASRRQLAWFNRTGKALGTMGATDENTLSAPSLSPDGRRVAVSRGVQQANADIWLLDGARTSRFTFDPASDQFPIWSPDGSRIVFRSNRKGTPNL